MKTLNTKKSRAYKLSVLNPNTSKQNIDKMDEILKNSLYGKSLCPDEFLNFAKYYINWVFETNDIDMGFDVKITMTSKNKMEKLASNCYAYFQYDYDNFNPYLAIILNKENFVIDYAKKDAKEKLKRAFTDFAHECEHCVQRLRNFKILENKDFIEDYILVLKELGYPKNLLNQKISCQGLTNNCEVEANQNSWINLLYLVNIFKQNNKDNEEYIGFLNILENEIYKDKKYYKVTTKTANLIEKKIDKHLKNKYNIECKIN